MTAPDLSQRLTEIKARLEKASAGPWEKRPGDVQDMDRGLPRPLLRKSDGQPIHAVAVRHGESGWHWVTTACETNVDFIAHARQDVPFLLERIRHLSSTSREVEWQEKFAAQSLALEEAQRQLSVAVSNQNRNAANAVIACETYRAQLLAADTQRAEARCPNCGCDYTTALRLRKWKDSDE